MSQDTALDSEQVQTILQAQYAHVLLKQQEIREAQDHRIRELEEQLRQKLNSAAAPSPPTWRDRARQPVSTPSVSVLEDSHTPRIAGRTPTTAAVASSAAADTPTTGLLRLREWEDIGQESSCDKRAVEKMALHEVLSYLCCSRKSMHPNRLSS